MPRKRFTDEKVRAVLQEYERGAKVPEICRRHKVSERTFYLWLRSGRGAPASTESLPSRIDAA